MRFSRKSCLIAGCSRFGATLAGELSALGYDTIIIDKDESSFRKLPSNYSGFQIVGDATDIDVLLEAGIEKAYILVAATDSDNVNCMISQIASTLYDVNEVYARLYDIDKSEMLKETKIKFIFPLTLCINAFEKMSEISFSRQTMEEEV